MERRTSRNLGGTDWRLGYLKGLDPEPPARLSDLDTIQQWCPARVPGNVRDDLMRAGRLPDLYFGGECTEHAWVNDCLWWYETGVAAQREPGQRVFLDFRGVDYRSVVFWNRTRLGSNEGMFARLLYEVTDLIEPTNTLRVRVAGSRYLPKPELTRLESAWRPLATKLQGQPAFPDRFGSVKCQMSYGWDFAPDLRAMGIWDDVWLHTSGIVFLERLALTAHVAEDRQSARLDVRAAVNAGRAGEFTFEIVVTGLNGDTREQVFQFPGYLRAGRDTIERRVTIQRPHLWHTWDRGPQALYRVTVRVWEGAELVDELSERFGFRDIALTRNPDTPAGIPDWTFTVNGDRLFVRGANWVPADSLPGRVRRDDYAALLTLAREANINMLRVWGGGLRERAEFYDLCAELGILVWQEFPFACAFLDRFQRSQSFLALVEKETSAIVKALQNAPAVALYCGGNEFSPRRNEPVVEVLRRVVTTLDPDRPLFEASPRPGDVHNWFVWHQFANARAYEEDESQFFSEFGLQALPDIESMQRFLPEEALWPPNELWTRHCAELPKLERYAKPMGAYHDLAGMVQASQRAQALALQIAIEHARRRKYACSGVMFWQFNEPWPAISWSVVDYYRRPKLAYATVQRCYAPVLGSVHFPHRRYTPGQAVPLTGWVINDTLAPLEDCRIELYMRGDEGRAFSMAFTVDDVPGDAATQAFELDLVLPDRPDRTLYVDVFQGETLLSSNHYDLGAYDGMEASRRNVLMYRLTNYLLS